MLSKEIRSTLRPFLRGLPLTLVLVFAAIWFAGKYVSYLTPVYESTARIKLADNQQGPTGSHLYDDIDYFATENKISAEIELIKSNSILEKVADNIPENYIIYRVGDLHSTELYDQSPVKIFSIIQDSSLLDRPFQLTIHGTEFSLSTPDDKRFTGQLGRSLTLGKSEILIARNEALLATRPGMHVDDNYRFVLRSKAHLVSEIRSNLDVMAMDKDVPVIRLSYKSTVPKKAHDVVNLVAACYIHDFEDTKYLTADTTVTFLDKQLKQYAAELKGSEGDIESYRNSESIINIHQETETDLRKISDLKKQLINIRMNLAAIDTLNHYIHQGNDRFLELAPNFEAFNDLLSTELMKKLKSYRAEKKELLTRYTSDHEKVRVVDENIADIIVYVKEGISNTKTNTQIKLRSLEREIAEAEASFVGLPSRERTLSGLERDNQMNEAIFRFLHEKKAEAEIARAAKMSFHRIIDFGQVPQTATSPNPSLYRALAAFLAFLLGTALSWLIFRLRFPIGDEEFIQKRTLLPIIKTIPFLKNKLSEQLFFSQWASVLWLNNYFGKGKILCLTAMQEGNQKEFITAYLAAALKQMGKKTLVIYAHEASAYKNKGQYFDTAVLDDMINDGQGWKSEKLAAYDCVLCDPGTLDQEARSFLILSACTNTLLVMDALRSKAGEVAQANEISETLQGLKLELILNRSAYYPALFSWKKVIGKMNKAGNVFNRRPTFKPAMR